MSNSSSNTFFPSFCSTLRKHKDGLYDSEQEDAKAKSITSEDKREINIAKEEQCKDDVCLSKEILSSSLSFSSSSLICSNSSFCLSSTATQSSQITSSALTEIEHLFFSSSSSSSSFDNPEFNYVEYINKEFPNEQSLNKLDSSICVLQDEIRKLDADILYCIRQQAKNKIEPLDEIKKINESTKELINKINVIKEKANESGKLVFDICKDVKLLHNCKNNLTKTTTALKRLIMLVTALDSLREYGAKRNYKSACDLVSVILLLLKHFEKMLNTTKINELMQQKDFIFNELQKQIKEDFQSILENECEYSDKLKDGCFLIDLIATFDCKKKNHKNNEMQSSVKNDIITHFALKILDKYKQLFSPGAEAYGLNGIERRFTWLKRSLREFDEKYAKLFPCSWEVPCHIAEHFCHITRQHLVEVLSISVSNSSPEVLMLTLQKSIEFENFLIQKFYSNYGINSKTLNTLVKEIENEYLRDLQNHFLSKQFNSLPGEFQYIEVLEKDVEEERREKNENELSTIKSHNDNYEVDVKTPIFDDKMDRCARFKGIITECFEAYLGTWVRHEEQALLDLLNAYTLKDCIIGADVNSNEIQNTKNKTLHDDLQNENEEELPRLVYSSAHSIFSSFNLLLKKTTTISTQQTLFEIFQVFKRVIKKYIDILNSRLPKKNTMKLAEESMRTFGCAIGSTEYVDETLNDLKGAILKVIDPSFQNNVNFDLEKDLLWTLRTNALQLLLFVLDFNLECSFNQMSKINWSAVQQVGECSTYVSEINDFLHSTYPLFYRFLSSSFYRFLSDKFAQMFITKFISSIYACKKIGVLGAQQLLLDSYSLKAMLLELPIVSANGINMPLAYSKFVVREMNKAEVLLKILTSNTEDMQSIQVLLDDDEYFDSSEEISKVLALRACSGENTSRANVARFSSGSALTSQQNAIDFCASQPSSATSSTTLLSSPTYISREFHSIGGTIREQSIKAAGDMKNFLGRFSKNK